MDAVSQQNYSRPPSTAIVDTILLDDFSHPRVQLSREIVVYSADKSYVVFIIRREIDI